MHRRNFISTVTAGYIAGNILADGTGLSNQLFAENAPATTTATSDFDTLTRELLKDWCDGMIANQIIDPGNARLHGALGCPACSHIHGRCSDAVYPFLHMAHVTGEDKYVDAAIMVYDWAENNVSQPDGSWTNDIDPKAWRGTSIFGAIGLAEALHYHGHLLGEQRESAWEKRLEEVASGYLLRVFDKIDFTNLNYGMTGVYGFNLLGRLLKDERYTQRSEEFASELKRFFTEPNKLVWGEGKPNDNRSGRGLLPVDLGYNVEESLNGLVLYALEVDDTELLDLLVESMEGHLEFMLPDGAWDNSWGTRSQKWCYWGSRTSDGCQPAFSLMARYNPAFMTAALKNAQLLKRCTADGLIHGGPHYVSHGVKPCIHHTFAHAKVMALVQDRMQEIPTIDDSTPLPREIANGVKHFPELDVWLAAKGPWRATVSAYDSIYETKTVKYLQQPTGGSLSVLYHDKVGTLLAGSMARYNMVEPLNMQPNPGEEFALTPRIESSLGDVWYTNLYDLTAAVASEDNDEEVSFEISTTLKDRDHQSRPEGIATFDLQYFLNNNAAVLTASASPGQNAAAKPQQAALVVPILSPTGEEVRQVSENRIEIVKPAGTVVVQCNAAMKIKPTRKGRVFNMVPGAEAVPIMIEFDATSETTIRCEISVV